MTDAQSTHLKSKFLERFRKEGNISHAAKGVCRREIVYQWKKDDPEFAAAYAEAEIEATEVLEKEATRRAVKGVKKTKGVYYEGRQIATEVTTEYSDTLLIFLLKARAPEKYRERVDLRHAGPNGGDIVVREIVIERSEGATRGDGDAGKA